MDAFRDRAEDALRKAATPALRKIREDARIPGLPSSIRKLLAYLEGHLFDPDLNVGSWRHKVQARDNSVVTLFRHHLGATPKDYLASLRLETAARMLVATDLDEHRIGRAVGYQVHRTFENRYVAWCGRKPSQDRGRPSSGIGPGTLRRAVRGELEAEELAAVLDKLRRLYPDLRPEPEPAPVAAAPGPRLVVDGREYERFQAEQIWQQIHALPFDEQQRTLRSYLFRSTALFDLLRRKSREEGRKDRRRGVDVARLALVSLDGHDEVFGERIHDLRAWGWAWLANARRLELDFEGAEKDFTRADEVWSISRAERDLRISAEIHFLKGALGTTQRRYEDALDRVEESIRLSRLVEDAVAQAQALTLRASLMVYTERVQESIPDLQLAAGLLEGRNEPYLDLTVSLNLANFEAQLGNLAAARIGLSQAEAICNQIDYRCGQYRIQHMEGTLCELAGNDKSAEASYMRALDGFLSMNEAQLAVLVALELAILDLRCGKRRRAVELTRWSIPILQSMKLHEETVAAIELLANESAAAQTDRGLLVEVARLLRLDPLVWLDQQAKAGSISRPSLRRF
jgi:AraC-like DNA-binding protein